MVRKIRPARMVAVDVQWGDVIVTAPVDSQVIGTVIKADFVDGYVKITVRTPQGPREMKPIAGNRPVWVHVPASSA